MGRVVKLYHRTNHGSAILADGFRDAEGRWGMTRTYSGVWVSAVPFDLTEGAEGDDLLVLAGHSPTAFAPYSACETVKPSYSSCPTRPLAEKA